jgi:ATP-dependent RNA helicase DeaD
MYSHGTINTQEGLMNLEKFKELGLSEPILKELQKKGFEEPTEIQSKIIPILLKENIDIVGQAQTGTGKTAAFGIPIIEQLEKSSKYTQALILTPTRELAIQVSEEINSFKGKKAADTPGLRRPVYYRSDKAPSERS